MASKKFEISEYPEGYDPNQSNAASQSQAAEGPLKDRLKNKLFKTRLLAF